MDEAVKAIWFCQFYVIITQREAPITDNFYRIPIHDNFNCQNLKSIKSTLNLETSNRFMTIIFNSLYEHNLQAVVTHRNEQHIQPKSLHMCIHYRQMVSHQWLFHTDTTKWSWLVRMGYIYKLPILGNLYFSRQSFTWDINIQCTYTDV